MIAKCPCCNSSAQTIKTKGVAATESWFYREYTRCKNKECALRTREYKRPGQSKIAWNTRTQPAIEETKNCPICGCQMAYFSGQEIKGDRYVCCSPKCITVMKENT